jgi:hypothetical protein
VVPSRVRAPIASEIGLKKRLEGGKTVDYQGREGEVKSIEYK